MYASAACQTCHHRLCLVPKHKTPRYFTSAISVRKWVDQLRSAKKSGEFSYQSNGGFLPMYVEVVLLGARRALGDCTPKKGMHGRKTARFRARLIRKSYTP